jgi:hypothetical protein
LLVTQSWFSSTGKPKDMLVSTVFCVAVNRIQCLVCVRVHSVLCCCEQNTVLGVCVCAQCSVLLWTEYSAWCACACTCVHACLSSVITVHYDSTVYCNLINLL